MTSTDANMPEMIVRSVFKKYDADGTGSIDAAELRRLLLDLGFSLSNDELIAALKVIDADGSKRVELDEFVAWWRQRDKIENLGHDQLQRTVELARSETVSPQVVPYLNRLSDLLFVLARAANAADGRPEQKWLS